MLINDGTGGYSVSWNAVYKWTGGVAPTLSTAANSVDIIVFSSTDAGTTVSSLVAGLDIK